MMKAIPFALFVGLLLVGCGEDSGSHLDAPESLNKAVLEKLILSLEGVKREWNYVFGEYDENDKSNPYGDPAYHGGDALMEFSKALRKKMKTCVDLLDEFQPIDEAEGWDKQALESLKRDVSKLQEEIPGKNGFAPYLTNPWESDLNTTILNARKLLVSTD